MLFIIYFELLQPFIHVFYGLFINVRVYKLYSNVWIDKCIYFTILNKIYVHLKSSLNVFWYKVYAYLYCSELPDVVFGGGWGLYPLLITFRQRWGGGVPAYRTTTDKFQADVTCSYSYEGSCRQLGSLTVGSCTFFIPIWSFSILFYTHTYTNKTNPNRLNSAYILDV